MRNAIRGFMVGCLAGGGAGASWVGAVAYNGGNNGVLWILAALVTMGVVGVVVATAWGVFDAR